MQASVTKVPALVGERDRLIGGEQLHDDVDALGEQLARLALVEPDHEGVGGQRPRPESEHEAAPREMVEQHGPFRDPQRIVIADAHHARAEFDVPGSLGGHPDEDLRRRDDLGSRRVVFADPRLVPPQPVEVLNQRQVSFQGQGGVVTSRVKRCHEDAEPESLTHDVPFRVSHAAPRPYVTPKGAQSPNTHTSTEARPRLAVETGDTARSPERARHRNIRRWFVAACRKMGRCHMQAAADRCCSRLRRHRLRAEAR